MLVQERRDYINTIRDTHIEEVKANRAPVDNSIHFSTQNLVLNCAASLKFLFLRATIDYKRRQTTNQKK